MASKRFQKQPGYTLVDQQIALMQNFPEAACYIHRSTLTWKGSIRPSPLSRFYRVTITYKVGKRPLVTVSGEELQGLDRPDFPHRFSIDRKNRSVNVCLHLPHEFDSSQLISECIIPWAAEWLYFYEMWLATGAWYGGGKHPGRPVE